MGGIPTNRFGSLTGGVVWDLGGAAGTVDITDWQYTDALSEAQEEISAGMENLTAASEWQGRQPPSWQFPPLWRSFIDAADRDAHLVPPHLLRSVMHGTAAGGLLLSRPIAGVAVDLIAAGGLFAAGGSDRDGSSGVGAPVDRKSGGSKILPPKELGPIKERDIAAMRALFEKAGKLPLFEKILANIRFINEAVFNETISKLREIVIGFLDGRPYSVALSEKGKSEQFILGLLKLPSRPRHIYTRHDTLYDNSGEKLLVVDEASYGGAQIIDETLKSKEADKIEPQNVMVATVGMTDHARNQIRRAYPGINIATIFRIPTIAQIFSPSERREMGVVTAIIGDDDYISREATVLTYFYFKVPDVFHPGLTMGFRENMDNTRPVFLIDDSPNGIWPPYRRNRREGLAPESKTARLAGPLSPATESPKSDPQAAPLVVAKGIREEVLAANAMFVKADTKKGFLDGKRRVHQSASQLRGTEHLLLPFDQAAGQVVLSLGSGPDVFRPIFNFPLAAEYHLLDTPRSWGTSPQEALDQLFWRLRALSADGEITLLDRGFLRHVSDAVTADRALFEAFLGEHRDLREPIAIELPVSTGTGKTVKRFYFHPLDYNDERGVTAMHESTLSGKGVGAIMATGVRWSMETMDQWLKRLEDGAVMINEGFVWKRSLDGQGGINLNMGRSFVYRDRNNAGQDMTLKELEDRYRDGFTVQFGAPARKNSITPEMPESDSDPFSVPIIFHPRSKATPMPEQIQAEQVGQGKNKLVQSGPQSIGRWPKKNDNPLDPIGIDGSRLGVSRLIEQAEERWTVGARAFGVDGGGVNEPSIKVTVKEKEFELKYVNGQLVPVMPPAQLLALRQNKFAAFGPREVGELAQKCKNQKAIEASQSARQLFNKERYGDKLNDPYSRYDEPADREIEEEMENQTSAIMNPYLYSFGAYHGLEHYVGWMHVNRAIALLYPHIENMQLAERWLNTAIGMVQKARNIVYSDVVCCKMKLPDEQIKRLIQMADYLEMGAQSIIRGDIENAKNLVSYVVEDTEGEKDRDQIRLDLANLDRPKNVPVYSVDIPGFSRWVEVRGYSDDHVGYDIGGYMDVNGDLILGLPEGMDVYPIKGGIVEEASESADITSNRFHQTVRIRHRDGMVSEYTHIWPEVKKDQEVTEETIIGRLASGQIEYDRWHYIHLHINVERNGEQIDPKKAIGIETISSEEALKDPATRVVWGNGYDTVVIEKTGIFEELFKMGRMPFTTR